MVCEHVREIRDVEPDSTQGCPECLAAGDSWVHLRFTLGWSGRRAAWVAVLSVVTIVVTFFGIGVVSDVHTMLL